MSKLRAIFRWVAMVVVAIIAISVVGILLLRHQNLADIADNGRMSLTITSADFVDKGRIPEKFACDTAVSPALAWSEPPQGTRSIAIVMEDPDAPFGFVHWVVYDLPSGTHALSEGGSSQSLAGHAHMGKNGYGGNGYVGPCPPFGTHHYIFRVYAADIAPDLPDGISKDMLMAHLKGHVLAEGTLVGIYGHKQK